MSDGNETFEVRLPAELASVAAARQAAAQWAAGAGVWDDAGLVDDVQLAVTEAAANVVRHAYPHTRPGNALVIRGERSETGLLIRISDHGRGFARAAAEGAGESFGGGLGFPVMRSVADRVSTEEAPGGGAVVTLEFRIRG